MVEATGLGWEGRNKQAELVVEFISSKTKKPEKAAKLTKLFQTTLPDLKGGYNYMKVDRMAYYVHKDTYLNALKKHKKLLN
jgi:hypothetical protein